MLKNITLLRNGRKGLTRYVLNRAPLLLTFKNKKIYINDITIVVKKEKGLGDEVVTKKHPVRNANWVNLLNVEADSLNDKRITCQQLFHRGELPRLACFSLAGEQMVPTGLSPCEAEVAERSAPPTPHDPVASNVRHQSLVDLTKD